MKILRTASYILSPPLPEVIIYTNHVGLPTSSPHYTGTLDAFRLERMADCILARISLTCKHESKCLGISCLHELMLDDAALDNSFEKTV